MIKLGINGGTPAPTEGAFQIYATANGVEIQDSSGGKININDLYNLANSLQLHIFGSGFLYEKFSDLPSSDVPVGAYAVGAKNGELFRATKHEGRTAWIPQQAYLNGSGFTIEAHINGDEANQIQLLEISKIDYLVWALPYSVVFSGSSGIEITIGDGTTGGTLYLSTKDLSVDPKNYNQNTEVWIISEIELVSQNSPDKEIFPIVFVNSQKEILLGSSPATNLDLFYHQNSGGTNSKITTNFWKSDTLFQTGQTMLLTMKLGEFSTIDSTINGEPYASNSTTDFGGSNSAWRAGLKFITSPGSEFTIRVNKFTVITRS